MKYILTFILFFFIMQSCNSDKTEKQNIQRIDPNQIRLNDVVHDSLSSIQIEKIKKIQSTFSEVFPVSLEETITNFKRDQNPDNEIEIWLQMANAYERFTKENPKLSLDVKKEAFSLILSRSMMSEQDAVLNSKLKLFTEEQTKDILNNYELSPKPLKIK